jgi:hypothetical protein
MDMASHLENLLSYRDSAQIRFFMTVGMANSMIFPM